MMTAEADTENQIFKKRDDTHRKRVCEIWLVLGHANNVLGDREEKVFTCLNSRLNTKPVLVHMFWLFLFTLLFAVMVVVKGKWFDG